MKNHKLLIIGLFAAAAYFMLSSIYIAQFPLDLKIKEAAKKYGDQEVLIVSKKDHLLYFLRDGSLVRGDSYGNRVYDFPVPVALGASRSKTPTGEFKVYLKNPNSKYTLFLGFLGEYGIHGAETRMAPRLALEEKKNPDIIFVTRRDNTRGCVAVENRVINYLYANVPINTPVLIMP